MNRLLILPILLLTLLVETPAFSADFHKGSTAYKSGDYATALLEWTPLAKQGDADAQFNLGVMYAQGKGVPQDYKTAVSWYRLAAEQGNVDAQFNLGLIFHEGQGVPQDYKTAVKWYRLAAEQGDADAQFNLGVMYAQGKGVPQDYKTAVSWYRLAAEQGYTDAQYNLGVMYAEGRGVPQDDKTAVKWYRLAAEQGDADAQKAVRDLEKKIASEKVTPPVIAEKAPSSKPDINLAGTGTGFSITRSGHMLTNHHVINGCQLVVLHIEGSVKKATVLARDKTNDLALLKANFTPKAVFSIKRQNADLMEEIMVAGYPFGRSVSSSVKITRGIVSSLTGIGDNYSNMQIDAAIQPGNSGGPIIDENGNVVGVAVARLDKMHFMKERGTIPENSNFGIKSSVAYNFAEANGIELPSEKRAKMSRRDMGKLVTKGTHYLSCWMTKEQLAKAQDKEELAMDIDPTLLRSIRGFADLRD